MAQTRNISHYENKSKEDLIKSLIETKPEPERKSKQTPKPEPKLEIKVNKKKLKNFDELR